MVRTVGTLLALVLAASACSSGEEPEVRPTPTASEGQVEEPLPCVPGTEPFTGAAADEFGPERVMAAYCLLVELAGEQERTSLALPVPLQRRRDLAGTRALLTPRAQKRGDLVGLTLHDVESLPHGYVVPDDGPFVYGTRAGPATADLADGGDALQLAFTLETSLVLEERGDPTGRHSLLPVSRQATYVLVPDGDEGWLVDDWDAEFSRDRVRLATG